MKRQYTYACTSCQVSMQKCLTIMTILLRITKKHKRRNITLMYHWQLPNMQMKVPEKVKRIDLGVPLPVLLSPILVSTDLQQLCSSLDLNSDGPVISWHLSSQCEISETISNSKGQTKQWPNPAMRYNVTLQAIMVLVLIIFFQPLLFRYKTYNNNIVILN